jgi:hypothetical protein
VSSNLSDFMQSLEDLRDLELPSIGWQLFILDRSQSDSTAFPSCLDTYATRLLTEPLIRQPHELLSLTADERGQLEELHGDARLKAQWWRRQEREAA